MSLGWGQTSADLTVAATVPHGLLCAGLLLTLSAHVPHCVSFIHATMMPSDTSFCQTRTVYSIDTALLPELSQSRHPAFYRQQRISTVLSIRYSQNGTYSALACSWPGFSVITTAKYVTYTGPPRMVLLWSLYGPSIVHLWFF